MAAVADPVGTAAGRGGAAAGPVGGVSGRWCAMGWSRHGSGADGGRIPAMGAAPGDGLWQTAHRVADLLAWPRPRSFRSRHSG